MDNEDQGLNRVTVTQAHVGIDREQGLVTVRFSVQEQPKVPTHDLGVNFAMTTKQAAELIRLLQVQFGAVTAGGNSGKAMN